MRVSVERFHSSARALAYPIYIFAVLDMESVEARVTDLASKVERLRSEVEVAAKAEGQAQSHVSVAISFVSKAQAKVQDTVAAAEALASSRGDAITENARTRSKVEDTTAATDALRQKFQRLGGDLADCCAAGSSLGTRNLDFESDGNEEAEQEEENRSAQDVLSALKGLSDRDLNEVRKLPKPPQEVRRALELVHALLAAAEGAASLPATRDLQWSALQRMLARDDFIKRVLALQPRPLSQQPKLLEEIAERWPSLTQAAGTTAPKTLATGRASPVQRPLLNWKIAQSAISAKENALAQENGSRKSSSAKVQQGFSSGGGKLPAKSAAKSTTAAAAASGRRMPAVVAAAAAEAEAAAVPTSTDLTIDAVEYASRACGALFRYCANCASAAMKMAAERALAKAELDAALHKLAGIIGEHSATQAYLASLTDQQRKHEEQKRLDEAAVDRASDRRIEAKLVANKALEALEALRAALSDAELKLNEAQSALERRRDADERRLKAKADRATQDEEDRRAAQAAIELDLATRKPERPPCWLEEAALSETCGRLSIDFTNPNATKINAATISKLANELRSSVSLRVHLAGHCQSDEDQSKAAQRAMAVGAALIAHGVLPLQLRAKGYGSKVPISRVEKLRSGSKSLRRVTVHALDEVRTRDGLEFGSGSADLGSGMEKVLGKVAALLLEPQHKGIKLCIEGHTDSAEASRVARPGDTGENADLSMERAEAVSQLLKRLGVDAVRLSPHGFGPAFPIDDNDSEVGRQRNRRVELLVIPQCLDTAAKTMGAIKDHAAAALASHTSNRPGVAKLLS